MAFPITQPISDAKMRMMGLDLHFGISQGFEMRADQSDAARIEYLIVENPIANPNDGG